MASMLAKCSLQAPCYIAERLSSGQAASCSPVTAMSQFTVRRPHHQRQAAAASAHAQTLQQAVRRRCAQPLRLPARARQVTAMQPYPDVPETEKERSPLDYPQEWITPQPSRRPDIFPEFDKQTTPMPKPMPGDPELPDEEEEEEEKKKKDPEKDPDKDPDKPQPDQPEEE